MSRNEISINREAVWAVEKVEDIIEEEIDAIRAKMILESDAHEYDSRVYGNTQANTDDEDREARVDWLIMMESLLDQKVRLMSLKNKIAERMHNNVRYWNPNAQDIEFNSSDSSQFHKSYMKGQNDESDSD